MDRIEAIKEKVHSLENEEKRTPVWDLLTRLYEENPEDPQLASLCMRQMVMYLDELEDPRWFVRERDDEYEDYYAFLQKILSGYDTCYRDNVEFQWALCHFLEFWPTYHFITGDTIHAEEAEHIRKKIIDRFMSRDPSLKIFEYIDQIQNCDGSFLSCISTQELQTLQTEIKALNLQDNYADQDLLMAFDVIAELSNGRVYVNILDIPVSGNDSNK
ncbi:MAG: hypothetical protein MJ142_07345 [Clostridia bacterium]|nr:hypothetical protein [Clostridia bacterium]